MEVLLSSVVVLLEIKKGKPGRVFPPLQQDFFTSPFSDSNYKMSTEFQILYGDSRKYKKSYWCTQCHLVAKTKFTKLEKEFKE